VEDIAFVLGVSIVIGLVGNGFGRKGGFLGKKNEVVSPGRNDRGGCSANGCLPGGRQHVNVISSMWDP